MEGQYFDGTLRNFAKIEGHLRKKIGRYFVNPYFIISPTKRLHHKSTLWRLNAGKTLLAREEKIDKNDARAYCTKLPIGLNRLPLKIKHIGPTVNLEVLRAQLSSEERTN